MSIPRKRVLVVTYYWPPSGGSGVQRTLKFCKYLREWGWEPVVLTVVERWAAWPDRDPGLEADVPDGTRVIRTRSWDPYAAYARFLGVQRNDAVGVGFMARDRVPGVRERLARWVRANVFIPDARVGWALFALVAAVRLHRTAPVEAVFTSGPPHSAHFVGRGMKHLFGLPWLADLRDAWPDMSYMAELPMGPAAQDLDRLLCTHTLRAASVRVTVSRDVAGWMAGRTHLPYIVVPNGFDPEDIARAQPVAMPGFSLVHTGNLGASRNLSPLWHLFQVDPELFEDIRIVLVGNVDRAVRDDIDTCGIGDRVLERAYVPHEEAIAFMKGASLLLLPINRVAQAAGIVTGKIYEYVASGRPVLGLGEPGGEADRVLRASGAGRVLAWDDIEGIGSYLRSHVEAWRRGAPVAGADPARAAPWSRRIQTGEIASLLDNLTLPAGAQHPIRTS